MDVQQYTKVNQLNTILKLHDDEDKKKQYVLHKMININFYCTEIFTVE